MEFKLSVVVRDGGTLNILSSRIILKHSHRLFLESLLEVPNGFIERTKREEKAQNKNALVTFQVTMQEL